MNTTALRTTVIGSYPFPAWLEFASCHLDQFGPEDIREMQADAVVSAIHDQVHAGLDVITDGEQTRLDFNLSFYGHLQGIDQATEIGRKWGPPAHDQRGKHQIISNLEAPQGLGVVNEFRRLQQLAPTGPLLKASVPGPYTLSGRLITNDQYPDRMSITKALIPIVRKELEDLVKEGCTEITVDEPSMSCYAYREDTRRFVQIFNDTIESVVGKCRLSTHLCFGNYKGHAVGYRRISPMFPDFLDIKVDEIHLEMANREFAEINLIEEISKTKDIAIGVIDVKSYYIETVNDIIDRIKLCLQYVSPEKLSVAPDCGLSQTARWAARKKLENMVIAAKTLRTEI
ncbi:MAG: methionine synthase [Saprospiraceae bacterium]|nr:methionine synthase [Saprospiraceae bacterium]